MKIQAIRLCVQTSVWVLASAFCVTSLAGCGANGNFTSQSLGTDTAVNALSGKVHGGPNPVANATVTLYATTTVTPAISSDGTSTNNYGYGVAGQVLGSTTTDSNGNFTLTGVASSCPAGQQAYIVSAGGNTGTNSPNSAALLMAALGPCSGISDSTVVIINEPTTIAAAYALSGFMTVSGTTVNISAPANNNAATGACTTDSTTHATTGCAAAGLAHAFLNAANLVNTTTGVAYSAPPSNSNGVVPQLLIYTLANTVEACVNSSGASSTACTTLMTNTTPTQIASPTAPTDTLSALLDLALYPSEATGCPTAPTTPCAPGTGSGAPTANATVGGTVPSAATTNLYNIANSNAYYTPALTTVPLDFTIAIAYTAVANTNWGQASDINDNHYVYANITPKTVFSLSSNGAAGWTTAINTNGGCGSFSIRCSVSADTLGNLWVVDSSGLTQLTTAGVLGTTYTTVDTLESGSVDLGNNVWLAAQTIGTANGTQTAPSGIEELVRGASAIVDVNVNGAPEPYALKQPVFDSAGNLWAESDNTGGSGGVGAILMISDSGSLTSPSFNTAGSGNGNPVNFVGGTPTPGNDPLIDPSGNLWYSAQNEMMQVPSFGGEANGAQNYIGPPVAMYGPIYEAGVERNAAMDGDGKIIIDATSTGSGYLSVFYPNAPWDGNGGTTKTAGADVYLNPCYIAPSTTVCQLQTGGESTIVNNPRSTTVDATGAIWADFQSSSFVLQILGPGAPAWGQKSYIPKALAPNLNGNTTSLRPF